MGITYDYNPGALRALRKQIPFAASRAINETLFDMRTRVQMEAVQQLDKPTRFTVQGFQVSKSSKRNLTGSLFIESKRWRYLRWTIKGGRKTAADDGGKALLFPRLKSRINQYGNLKSKRKLISRAEAAKNQFVGKPDHASVAGIWQKLGGKRNPRLRLIAQFGKSADYQKTFAFFESGRRALETVWQRNWDNAIEHALRTARPPLI